MSSIEDEHFSTTLINEINYSQPGVLPSNARFECYIGHTVRYLSNTTLAAFQTKAPEKGTAMGIAITPNYGNLFMDGFETNV